MSSCQPTFIFRQGDTWKRRFLWRQDGETFNLRFTEAKFQIRTFEGELIAEASTEEDSLIIHEEIGAIDLYLDWMKTEFIDPGVYVADMELRFIDNTVQSTPPIIIQVVEDITNLGEAKQPKDKVHVQKADVLSIKQQILAKKAGYK